MVDRVEPNFKQWSDAVLDRSELEEALRQAYRQGYSAGFMDGDLNGWYLAQEKDNAEEG